METKYRIGTILPNYRQLLERAESTRSHNIIRLSQHKNFKVAIHIIPSHFNIPAHLHPNLIGIIVGLLCQLRKTSHLQRNYYITFNN